MHKRVRDDVTLEAELRRALPQDELFVVYQPLVDLVSGALTGWRHWCAGSTRCAAWCHQWNSSRAEACGLIESSALCAANRLRRVRASCKRCWAGGAALSVGQPSRAQLRDPALVANVRDVLRASGMEAIQLQLEVTRSLPPRTALCKSDCRSFGRWA